MMKERQLRIKVWGWHNQWCHEEQTTDKTKKQTKERTGNGTGKKGRRLKDGPQ